MASVSDYQDYYKWVKTESEKHPGTSIGQDGHPVTAFHIPIGILQQYWHRDRVLHFLPADSGFDADYIIEGYLRIFSTLVYLSTAEHSFISYLDLFSRGSRDDNQLPFRHKEDLSPIFLDPLRGRRAADAFYKHQFLFCPRQLASATASGPSMKLHNTTLLDHDILPMVLQRDLTPTPEGRLPSVATLKLFKLAPSSGLRIASDAIVAKIFPKSEVDYSFQNELAAYSALKRTSYSDSDATQQCFLNYYGSFIQNGTGVILLEYADRGSLLEFFRQGDIPYTRDEMFGLWSSLSNLLPGLAALHNLDRRNTGGRLRGVHQDLKPSNIFVFSEGGDPSYRFSFKIGDFGLSSFALFEAAKGNDSLMPDNKSTKLYGAPELMSWDPRLDHLDNGVIAPVDMWSIGCVLFDVVVWCVCGERGLKEFFADRKLETARAPEGCHGSFHNGTHTLEAVQTMADKLLERRRYFDNLTQPLCKLLCSQFLIPNPIYRLTADQAVYRLQKTIKEAANDVEYNGPRHEMLLTPPPTSGRSSAAPPTGAHSPSASNYPEHLTARSSSINRFPSQRSSAEGHLSDAHLSPAHWEDNRSHYDEARLCAFPGQRSMTYTPGHSTGQGSTSSSERGDESGGSRVSVYGSQQHGTSSRTFDMARRESLEPRATPPLPRPQRQPSDATTIAGPPVPRTGRTLTQRTLLARNTLIDNNTEGMTNVTVRQLKEMRAARNSGGSHELPAELRGVIKTLQGRDQVFLVDNSPTMLRYWAQVMDTFEALVWVVKNVDPDGVELRFTSEPTREFKGKNTTSLLSKFPSFTPKVGDNNCIMETALNVLIDNLIPTPRSTSGLRGLRQSLMNRSTKTGISIYILTNGIWTGSAGLCGVDKIIRTLIGRLQDRRHGRAYVTLQFIRFGHERIGKERLRHLDNNIEEASEWDIVDRRYFEGAVKPMLIGALAEDDYPSDDSEDDQPGPSGLGG